MLITFQLNSQSGRLETRPGELAFTRRWFELTFCGKFRANCGFELLNPPLFPLFPSLPVGRVPRPPFAGKKYTRPSASNQSGLSKLPSRVFCRLHRNHDLWRSLFFCSGYWKRRKGAVFWGCKGVSAFEGFKGMLLFFKFVIKCLISASFQIVYNS